MENLQALRDARSLSITKSEKKVDTGHSGSIAYSTNGDFYSSGSIESDTNLLEIPSELGALVRAVHHNDFGIVCVVTLSSLDQPTVSPSILKILVDFGTRTGRTIAYELRGNGGSVIKYIVDPALAVPFYRSPVPRLPKVGHVERSIPIGMLPQFSPEEFKRFTRSGIERNFPTYDSASGYGAAVRLSDGTVLYGGQYSSPDKRLGLHAEMAVALNALMTGRRDITHLGLIATKFPDTPCTICGVCRQFLFELETKIGTHLSYVCFAKESSDYRIWSMADLLPEAWSSKKW